MHPHITLTHIHTLITYIHSSHIIHTNHNTHHTHTHQNIHHKHTHPTQTSHNTHHKHTHTHTHTPDKLLEQGADVCFSDTREWELPIMKGSLEFLKERIDTRGWPWHSQDTLSIQGACFQVRYHLKKIPYKCCQYSSETSHSVVMSRALKCQGKNKLWGKNYWQWIISREPNLKEKEKTLYQLQKDW